MHITDVHGFPTDASSIVFSAHSPATRKRSDVLYENVQVVRNGMGTFATRLTCVNTTSPKHSVGSSKAPCGSDVDGRPKHEDFTPSRTRTQTQHNSSFQSFTTSSTYLNSTTTPLKIRPGSISPTGFKNRSSPPAHRYSYLLFPFVCAAFPPQPLLTSIPTITADL